MANRQSNVTPYRVPRVTTLSAVEDIDGNSIQVDPSFRNRQVRWTDAMDGCMINALIHQMLAGPRRSDNGFTTFQVSKAIESVNNGCGVLVSDKNVRSRLKTLKKEYLEVRQLLSMSGFGLDPNTGRITADPLAWEEFLKGKAGFEKWKSKSCPRYDDFEAVFGNDTATGDRSLTGNDNIPPIDVSNENLNEVEDEEVDTSPISLGKRKDNGESNKGKDEGGSRKRNRNKPNDLSIVALSTLAESSKRIAKVIEMQVSLDTSTHINWQCVLEKLKGMNIAMCDFKQVMKFFRKDNSLANIFMSLTDEEYMHDWVLEQLGNIPPPHV